MANIVVISNDMKIQRQVVTYLRELDKTHHVRTFERGEDFLRKYTMNPVETDEENDEALNLPFIDFVIFQSGAVDKRIRSWTEFCDDFLKQYSLYPSGEKTKFIGLRYDDDGSTWRELHHPQIIDIFLLPLDRLLVLQKLEILLNLPEIVSPSYLFSQNVDLPIEVSKQSTIEGLSENSMVIRNPVPLKPGVPSHVFFTIPEGLPYAGTVFNVFGKTFHSEPHPEFPGNYRVYLSFFGLSKDLGTKLRALLSRTPRYNYFKQADASQFKFDPRNIFVSDEDKEVKNIVVLDLEREQAIGIADKLITEVGNLEIFACSSYYRFQEAHFLSEEEREMGQPARAADFPASEVKFTISKEEWEVTVPPADLKATDELLGHNIPELFAKPDGWQAMFQDLYHANILSETLRAAELEKMLRTNIEAQSVDGSSLIIAMEIVVEGENLAITLKPPVAQQEHGKYRNPLERIDMMFINSHLIPRDVEGWLERFEEKFKENRLGKSLPKIVVMADSEETALSPLRCMGLPFYGYIEYPVNMHQVAFTCATGIHSKFSRYTIENLNYADIRLPVYLAKHAMLEGLSEFGSSVVMSQPIADGALLYLHGSIFENAPGGHLCARFYLSEPHPENKDKYRCHFLYYAIDDAFLKYTRNFIREQYTSGKEEAAT